MDPTPYDVFAVELSSFQLHYTESLSAEAAAVLNLAEDHLDWYDGPHGMADYAADKGRIYHRVQQACVYNVADPETERLVRDADVEEGAARSAFTLGHAGSRHGGGGRRDPRRPGVHRRATVERRRARDDRRPARARPPTSSPTRWPRPRWPGPTAYPRRPCATGCAPSASTATGSPPSPPPRGSPTSTTRRRPTPTPPCSSLLAYDSVVWIAGGLAKGAHFDELVGRARDRLRAAVLIGRDRDVIARGARATRAGCSRSSPSTPTRLAPDMPPWNARSWPRGTSPSRATPSCWPRGAPRWTCSPSYADRGDAFAAAVRRLTA